MTKTFCPLPWSSVAIRNDGYYRVCCHANVSDHRGLLLNDEGVALNAQSCSLEEARSSKTLRDVRAQMRRGEWPEACGRCQREEAVGLRSKRIYANELLQLDVLKTLSETGEDGSLSSTPPPLRDLDLRFGNKCNLKCRMCGPTDSSAWYGDYEALTGRAYSVPETLSWHENQQFWQDLQENSQLLEHIYIVGGEPLLIEQHYDFLSYLIERKISSQVVLEYNTNLTILPEKVLDLWQRFKQVRVGVSVDAWGPLNNYIRHPSRFSVLEKNLERLDKAGDNIVVWLACTVSLLNFYDLSELMLWKLRKKFKKINISPKKPLLTPHVLHKPEFLNLQCLPAVKKEKILGLFPKMQYHFSQELKSLSLAAEEQILLERKWQELYDSFIKHMMARDLAAYYPEFLTYTQKLDGLRGEQLQNVISPEYAEIILGQGDVS